MVERVLEQLDRNIPILVIDQQPTMRAVVKNILGKLGFKRIDEVDSAEKAIDKLNSSEFRFIIADWNIQDIPIAQLLTELRHNQKYSEVPVLIVATEAQKAKLREIAEQDRTSLIVKPFTADILGQKMEEALASKSGH